MSCVVKRLTWSAGKCIALGLLIGVSSVPLGVSAQDSGTVALGETRLAPALRVDYVSIDNLFRKAVDPVSATGVIVRPELGWQADRRLILLEADYVGAYGFFSREEAEYDDHDFRLSATADLSSRQRASASLNVRLGHEEQGTGQTRGLTEISPEQIEFGLLNAQLSFGYGARQAKGNVRGGLAFGSVDYSNLEQITDGDDYVYVRPFAEFSYRVSPDTRLIAEVRFGTLDFDDDRRDRTEVRFLTGVEMSTSSKFGGDARVGILQASFDEQSTADSTELIAEVGVYYELTSFSRLDLSFDRDFVTVDDSNNDNAGRSINDDASLDWSHQWSSRVETISSIELRNNDRECPAGVDDRTVSVGLELNFSIRRWLQLGLSGLQITRDVTACANSNEPQDVLDYERTDLGVHIRGTL